MKRLALVLTLAIALLVPAAAALAVGYSLPQTTSSKIVVPDTVAGIKLGMSEAKARAAWGSSRGSCTTSGTAAGIHTDCNYGDYLSASTGSAVLSLYKHKVTSVYINSARVGTGDPNFKAAGVLAKMKTAEGFGIGAKYPAVKKAYPKGTLQGTPKDERFIYTIKGKGKTEFTFTFWGENQKAFIIGFQDGIYHP